MIGANNVINVKRLTTSGGQTDFPGTFHLQNIDSYIEKIQPEKASILDSENALTLFTLIVDDTPDILTDDKIIDQNGNEYIIKGEIPYSNPDVPDHSEFFMSKEVE